MPYAALQMKPGIDVTETPMLNSAGFSYGSGVRFFQGLPQKKGGWTALNTGFPLTGIARGMHGWADISGNPYIAAGSASALQVWANSTLYDITPIRATDNVAPAISTTLNSATVTVKDAGNGAVAGDTVLCIVPISVGGLILYGSYVVQSVVDFYSYTLTAASLATATVVEGGAVPSFTATAGSAIVTVTLADHGLISGNTWNVDIATTVGGIDLYGPYLVTVLNANQFTITAYQNATAPDTVSENSGQARFDYLIHPGQASTTVSTPSAGYGAGDYGAGPYGLPSTGQVTTRCRQWFLDNFGAYLIGNYNGSPIYVWEPPAGSTNRAIPVDMANFPTARQPPATVNMSFMSAPQQILIALGCDDPSNNAFDPLLVRWCSSGDFTDWQASSTNSAGSYPIPSGSRLVGGVSAPNFVIIWTDVDMWAMSYLGGGALAELVWGFTKINGSWPLIAPRAAGILGSTIFWPTYDGFCSFDGGRPVRIPCPVWDKFWYNLNRVQVDKVNIQCNSVFDEITWAFPSASGSGEVDQCITLTLDNGAPVWTYDDQSQWARTSWIDNNVFGPPVGTDTSGLLQQHETSNDANGSALPSSVQTGWFSVQEGSIFSLMERIEADLIATGGTQQVQVTVYTQDYETGPVRTYGPYNWVPGSGPPWSIVRARGRFYSIKIGSTALGVFWRLGRVRYRLRAAGRR